MRAHAAVESANAVVIGARVLSGWPLGTRAPAAMPASLLGLAVVSAGTWVAGILVLGSGSADDGSAVPEIVIGIVSSMAAVVALVGSHVSVTLWQLNHRRRYWLVLATGMFVIACAEGVFGLRQLAAAYGPPGLAGATSCDVPSSALLAGAGTLVWFASLHHHRGHPGELASTVPAGGRHGGVLVVCLFVGAAVAWLVPAAVGTVLSARVAGLVLAATCTAGGMWFAAARRQRLSGPEPLFGLAFVALVEAGVAQAVLAPASPAAVVCPAAFRLQALICCTLGVISELGRWARRGEALSDEQQRVHQLRSLLAKSEIGWRSAAHQVRSALLLLSNGVALLGDGQRASDVTAAEALVFIQQATARIAATVGTGSRPLGAFDVAAVIDVEVRAASGRGQRVRLEPQCTVPCPGSGDPTVLARVMGELLDNAARHAPGSTVTVVTAIDGPWVEVTVADDGPGIASAGPDPLVAAGWRAELGLPSSGLGLAIARWLLESEGGSLAIRRRPGQRGTVATIRLPGARVMVGHDAARTEGME